MRAEPEKIVLSRCELQPQDFAGGGDFAQKFTRVGPLLGLTRLGCALQVVAPGKKAFPHHVHHMADEMMVILEGAGTYRWGDERFPIKAGDMVGAPMASRAHQIENTGGEDLVYLTFSTNPEADIVQYPDSGKVAYRAGVIAGDRASGSIRAVGRMSETDYWDGEVQ